MRGGWTISKTTSCQSGMALVSPDEEFKIPIEYRGHCQLQRGLGARQLKIVKYHQLTQALNQVCPNHCGFNVC